MTTDVLVVCAVVLSFAVRRPLHLVALRAIDARNHHPAGRSGDVGTVTAGPRHGSWRVGWPGVPPSGRSTVGSPPCVRSLALPASVLANVALAAAVITLVAELGLWGFRLPVHHRQVNEHWLDQFRPWVYAGGFGWQVGTGLATYVVTPALYLMILMAALTTTPWVAVAVAASFGLIRGLAVLLGRRITNAQSLTTFHQRFHHAEPRVWRALVGVECAVAFVCAWVVSPWVALGLILVAVPVVTSRRLPSRSTARSG